MFSLGIRQALLLKKRGIYIEEIVFLYPRSPDEYMAGYQSSPADNRLGCPLLIVLCLYVFIVLESASYFN